MTVGAHDSIIIKLCMCPGYTNTASSTSLRFGSEPHGKQTNKQTNKQQKEQLHVLLQSQRTATLYSDFTFLLFSPGMERGNKLAAGYVQD